MRKFLVAVIISLFVSYPLKALSITCEANPTTAVRVATASIATLYNVFPIKIGGITVLNFSGLEDLKSVTDVPICVCMDPIPRVGIKVSFWEPIALAEVVKAPWCMPTAGLQIPAGVVTSEFAIGEDTAQSGVGKMASHQAHWVKFPVFAILNALSDFICLSKEPFDYGYLTEVDLLWQNDIWAAILGPEAFLFANPIAQMVCMVDAITSAVGFPLDPLFWCMGGWQSTYPMSKHVSGASDVTANLAIAGKLMMKLHRELVLWGSIGEAGLCGLFPMPIWRKSQYGVFPVYPITYPLRIPIGRTDMLWGAGLDVPGANMHNWVNAVYRKRDCCAF
ncbi:MAG: TraU family protein [Candidatus Aenigmatarchaeota archaeon]